MIFLPYNMQSGTEPENVGSGDSLKVLQPLENVGSSTMNMRSEGEHNDKHGEYISQQHIIKKKMLELSPAEDLYTPAMARFQYLIHSQYDDNDYAEGWKRWRAESLLWDYYFSSEPFPGKKPPKALESILSTAFSSEEMFSKQAASPSQIQPKHDTIRGRSTDCRSKDRRTPDLKSPGRRTPDRRSKNRRTPDPPTMPHRRSTDRYHPGLKDQTDSYRPPRNEKEPCRLTPIKQSSSSRTLKDEKENSPQLSTQRDLRLGTAVGITRSDNLGGGNDFSTRNVANSVTRANLNNPNCLPIGMLPTSRRTAPSQTAAPRAVSAVHNTGDSYQPIQLYQSMERLMEKKAILLGMRQRFFQVLQKKRDIANLVHHGCSKQYKHWLAYSSTWSTLFTTPYPEIEPVGPSHHSESCLCLSTKPVSSVASPPRSTEKRMALVPILGDADSCWKEYENKYNSTDLDRLLIEEQAKREGELRMVLDEATGEVINLKLFTARTQQRALKPLPREPSAHADMHIERYEQTRYYSSTQKRKSEVVEEGEIVEKKLRQ